MQQDKAELGSQISGGKKLDLERTSHTKVCETWGSEDQGPGRAAPL